VAKPATICGQDDPTASTLWAVSAIIFEHGGVALSTAVVSVSMLGFNRARSQLALLAVVVKIMTAKMIKPTQARVATAPNPNIVIEHFRYFCCLDCIWLWVNEHASSCCFYFLCPL